MKFRHIKHIPIKLLNFAYAEQTRIIMLHKVGKYSFYKCLCFFKGILSHVVVNSMVQILEGETTFTRYCVIFYLEQAKIFCLNVWAPLDYRSMMANGQHWKCFLQKFLNSLKHLQMGIQDPRKHLWWSFFARNLHRRCWIESLFIVPPTLRGEFKYIVNNDQNYSFEGSVLVSLQLIVKLE